MRHRGQPTAIWPGASIGNGAPRRFAGDNRAATAVEFALIFPTFIVARLHDYPGILLHLRFGRR
jgi:Flp pilus assembly protein TadG